MIRIATETDIDLMREKQANEEVEARDKGTIPGGPEMAGPSRTLAGVLTKAGSRADPEARANVTVAQRILCYAVHFTAAVPPRSVSSLDFHDDQQKPW